MQLAIIGTAGRNEESSKIDVQFYDKMKVVLWRFLKKHKEVDSLISGGAAVADHLAVKLFINNLYPKLTLALPTKFDLVEKQFEDTKAKEWYKNPGKTANYYHRLFKEKTNIDSLGEIKVAILKGADIIIEKGFYERNTIIANADMIIAFTFGNGKILKDGGSNDTMKKFLAKHDKKFAYHVDLNNFELYNGAETA